MSLRCRSGDGPPSQMGSVIATDEPRLTFAGAPGLQPACVVATFVTAFRIRSSQSTEWLDVTPRVNEAVQASGLTSGITCVSIQHTTAALLINEFQPALIADLIALATRLVPDRAAYRHNDPRYSDCERGNAQAHLRAALLGRGVTVPIADGHVSLGRYQSIILAEFDGPRPRDVSVKIVGER